MVVLVIPQLSLVMGDPSDKLLFVHNPGSALTVILAGHVIIGGCASPKVTVKEQLVEFPDPSVT